MGRADAKETVNAPSGGGNSCRRWTTERTGVSDSSAQHQREHGRLPESLTDLGFPEGALAYRVNGDQYELGAAQETGDTITLSGEDDPMSILERLGLSEGALPVPPGGTIRWRYHPMTLGSDRRGFTMAEVAIVVMVVGILAGITLPNLRYAMLKADAAHIVSDAHTISLAAYEQLSETGSFPSSGAYGVVPSQMEDYLPENYEFRYRGDVLYAWFSFTLPSGFT